jgi:hypothetical protein
LRRFEGGLTDSISCSSLKVRGFRYRQYEIAND